MSGHLRITTRGIQITLGMIWLLDGLLQFQSFMYTHRLITEVFGPATDAQPGFIAASMKTVDAFYGRDLMLWNTLAGEIQCAIGLALIVSKRTVRPALLVSFVWALVVWWFGEGFGGLISHLAPSPLMGAPGAAILYAIIGLLVWPRTKEEGRSAADGGSLREHGRLSAADSGPLGDRGGLVAWSGLWLLSALLWVLNDNRANGSIHHMLAVMATASPLWLAHWQSSLANLSQGHGEAIALGLTILSLALAIGVWTALRWPALAVGIVLSLAYWVFGQSLGGPFWIGTATDPSAGPLFVLLAFTVLPMPAPASTTHLMANTLTQTGLSGPEISLADEKMTSLAEFTASARRCDETARLATSEGGDPVAEGGSWR